MRQGILRPVRLEIDCSPGCKLREFTHAIARESLVLAALWVPAMGWGQAGALRFSASSTWGMPYGDVREDQLLGGIVFELMQAIGLALNVPVRYVVLSRNRLEAAAQAGEINVRCYFNPAWTKAPEQYVFSAPLFDASDVLVGARDQGAITDLAHLPQGATVGTVIGFVYPSLTQRFQDRSLLHDDALDQENVLLKLGLGRSRYAVVNSRVLAWFSASLRAQPSPTGPCRSSARTSIAACSRPRRTSPRWSSTRSTTSRPMARSTRSCRTTNSPGVGRQQTESECV